MNFASQSRFFFVCEDEISYLLTKEINLGYHLAVPEKIPSENQVFNFFSSKFHFFACSAIFLNEAVLSLSNFNPENLRIYVVTIKYIFLPPFFKVLKNHKSKLGIKVPTGRYFSKKYMHLMKCR